MISEIVNLQASLDAKLDSSLVNIVGQTILIKGETITVPTATGGGSDDRIPNSVTSGNYLRFIGTAGEIEEVTTVILKEDLGINNVDNTTDLNKPISTLQAAENARLQAEIDAIDTSGGSGETNLGITSQSDSVTITSDTGTNATINEAS